MTPCAHCGYVGKIANECRCDPNNLPTIAPDTTEERRYRQRRERFALAAYKAIIAREDGSKLTDWKELAKEAVMAADFLDEELYPIQGHIPDYVP